jgi:hypothetical protein
MTLLKRLVSVLCLAFLFTSYSNSQELVPGQIYTTGNVVVPTTTSTGSTWTGAVYQDNLTCWTGGDPGYCGPQAIVRPGNQLNFSYGSTYVYQQQHISTILPAITGLQVNGYNFSFTAKNGNGWDDGRVDQLTALVRFWDNTGGRGANNLLYGNSWNLSYKYNWTNFNYSDNFATPLAMPSIGQVQYGFIGKDNNGWAGPYGPEVYNVSFSLKYSVDPCSSNPLSSPTCKGYLDALAKLMPATTTTTAATQPEPTPVAQAVVEQPVQQATAPAAQQTVAPTTAASAPTQQTTQTAVATTSTTQEKSSATPGNLSFALNLIARNADREKAIQQQAVATATAEATAASDKAVAVATTTAATSAASSTASDSAFTGGGIQVSGSSNRTATLTTVQQQQNTAVALQSAQSTTFTTTQSQQSSSYQLNAPTTVEMVQTTEAQGLFETQAQRQQEIELPQQLAGFISDRNNPLREIILPTLQQQVQQQQPAQQVNRNVQPNEAAVGVALERMMVVPQGYASYTNLALRDANFYEPKEVYRNQQVVDNVRVLRGLGSDQKHRDLVNLQYK